MHSDIPQYLDYSDPQKVQIQKFKAEANFIIPPIKILQNFGDPLHSINIGESFYNDNAAAKPKNLINVNPQNNKSVNRNLKSPLKSILKKSRIGDKHSKVFNQEKKFVKFCLQKNITDPLKNKIQHRIKIHHKQVAQTNFRLQIQII